MFPEQLGEFRLAQRPRRVPVERGERRVQFLQVKLEHRPAAYRTGGFSRGEIYSVARGPFGRDNTTLNLNNRQLEPR